jgi:hypothetical protein
VELYPEHPHTLEPLLRATAVIRERADFAPRPSFRMASRERLLRRLSPRPSKSFQTSVRRAQPRQTAYPVFSKRFAMLWTTIFVLAVSLITGGTVYALGETLPGDVLYPVKLSIEDSRLLISDDAGDVLLATEFVQVRMEEIQTLIDSGRAEDLPLAANLLAETIALSTDSLAAVARNDPERAEELSRLLEETLSIHIEILTSRLGSVPDQAQPAIQHAIDVSSKGRDVVQKLFEDGPPGGGPPDGVPSSASTQPAGVPPDDIPGPASTPPGGGPPGDNGGQPNDPPSGGPPDDIPRPASTQPGGGPPNDPPGGGQPGGTGGPPNDPPGGGQPGGNGGPPNDPPGRP